MFFGSDGGRTDVIGLDIGVCCFLSFAWFKFWESGLKLELVFSQSTQVI